MEKELKSLLASFEKATEWEWSDLIQWITKVKSLFDSFKDESFPDKITLEKRLWQCLNPALPQGLHSITLKIYESILSRPRLQPEDFALFLTGILPFFQYASSENRCQVISILNSTLKERVNELKLSLPGVVIALLPGLDEDSNVEVAHKTIDLLDGLALKGGQEDLFYSVWQALLSTPRVRFGALGYLKVRIPRVDDDYIDDILPNKLLVVNSLRAALGDEVDIVRRNAMGLLVEHFPINIAEDIITTKEKILLIEAVLRLFLFKEDFYAIRRIWPWIFQGENMDNQENVDFACELIIEAMKSIFSSDNPKLYDPLDILSKLFEQESLTENLMKELIVPLLIYVEKHKSEDKDGILMTKCITLLGSSACFKNDCLIWESLSYFFEENLYGDLIQAIKVIKFYFYSFVSFNSDINSIKPLFEKILTTMHGLSQQQLTDSLDLALIMVTRFESAEDIDISDAVKGFQEFFVQLSDEEFSLKDYKKALDLLVTLDKFSDSQCDEEWLNKLKDFTSTFNISLVDSSIDPLPNYELALLKIHCLIELLKRESRSLKKDLSMIDIFDQLWKSLDSSSHYKKAVNLLIQFEKVDHENFVSELISKLECQDEDMIDDCMKNINFFILFWRVASERSYEDLQRIFSQGEVISSLIQHLDRDYPEVSHKAGQWLIEILPNLACVLTPIFNELIHSINHVESQYSHSLSKGLKQLRQIVKHGGDMIIKRAYEITVPESLSEQFELIREQQGSFYKINEQSSENSFLQLMIEISLLVLLIEDNEEICSRREMLRIKMSACEFLMMILRQKYAPLAYLAVDTILYCMNKSFDVEILTEEILHLQLLNILSIIFFDCGIETSGPKCKELLESPLFKDVYLKGLSRADSYIRSQWINFITNSFDLIISTVSLDLAKVFITELINDYCVELEKAQDKVLLINGLKEILHKSLAGSSIEIEKTIKEKLPYVIEHLVGCCRVFKTQLEISTLGTKKFTGSESKPHKNSEVIELLMPIIYKDQLSVMNACFQVWMNFSTEQFPTTETNDKLKKLIGLIVSLETNANSIFFGLKYTAYMVHTSKPLDSQVPARLAHFVYTISCLIPIDKFASEINFWDVLVDFCKELEKVQDSVIVLWISEIINLLLERLSGENKDKSYYKSLYEYVQSVIKRVTKLCLIKEDTEIKHPYPPSLYEYDIMHKINSGSLLSLKSTLYSTVTILWRKESQEKIISQFQSSTSQILQALTSVSKTNFDTQLMSELLASLLNSGKSFLSKLYRKEIIEFFTSPSFFDSMNESLMYLESWCQIIKCISDACYGDRYSLITDLFNRMYSGVFTRSTNNLLRARALKCISFVVYSGGRDEYHACTPMICEKLIELIKVDDVTIKNLVYHCTIVLLLRLSAEALNDFWPRLWPHILTDMWQVLSDATKAKINNGESPYLQSIFLLIDVLTTLMNQDFQLYKWVFFYESLKCYNISKKLNDEVDSIFTPFFPLLAGSRHIGIKEEFEVNDDAYKTQERKLMLEDDDMDATDLKHLMRKMIRDVIKYSQVISVPNMESVKSRIEMGFFSN